MERSSSRGDYDPLAAMNHADICENFLVSMNGDTSGYVHSTYDQQMQLQRTVFLAFQYLARQTHEVNENDTLAADTTQVAVFKSGVTLALGLLEHMAASLNIDIEGFYQHWEDSRVVMLPSGDGDQLEIERIKALTAAVKQLGEHHLENLPSAYKEFVEKSEINYVQVQGRTDIFEAGFGYVLGSGYVALQYMYERKQLGDIDFDSMLSWSSEKTVPTHQSQADKFVHLIESGRDSEDASLESIIGTVMQDNIHKYEQMFEIFHALALAVCREEGELDMDATTEAFFTGANLGAHIAIEMGESQLGEAAFIRRWCNARLHRELGKFGPEEHEHARTDARKALRKLRNTSTIPNEYTALLKLIDEEQEYDSKEGAAFGDGFLYSLATFLREIQSQKNGEAKKMARQEARNFDDEFNTFMRENDLTGNLQEVSNAYTEHCQAFGLDPDNLTEDEADTILELTLQDYDRLMPEVTEIEVHAPCFLQILEDDNDATAVLLEAGGKMKAEIAGFRLSVAPADSTYLSVNPETAEAGSFPIRYMPSYVLKNVYITLPDGTEDIVEDRIVIGFAVPGVTFRRIDF